MYLWMFILLLCNIYIILLFDETEIPNLLQENHFLESIVFVQHIPMHFTLIYYVLNIAVCDCVCGDGLVVVII